MPMQFNEKSKPIYLQIADRLCDDVTTGVYAPDCRIPSVRESAAAMQVNFNTVMRTYEYLASKGIIYNKRGVGYFISPDAMQQIEKEREATFFNDELRYFFSRLRSIGVAPEKLGELYEDFIKKDKD